MPSGQSKAVEKIKSTKSSDKLGNASETACEGSRTNAEKKNSSARRLDEFKTQLRHIKNSVLTTVHQTDKETKKTVKKKPHDLGSIISIRSDFSTRSRTFMRCEPTKKNIEMDIILRAMIRDITEDMGLDNNQRESLISKESDNAEVMTKTVFIDDIRIKPGKMVFNDAYEGKEFKQAITLTNCGKTSVNIRIFPPTSKAIHIKAMPIGISLCPGLSVIRYVSYVYKSRFALPLTSMDIYINNRVTKYDFIVNVSKPFIDVSPKVLEFNEIDMGIAVVRKMTIKNSGSKQAPFSVDLGQNPLDIVVCPLKGTLQPGESKELHVEIFGTTSCPFTQVFWIKTEPLQRIVVQGTFIVPRLSVEYPTNNSFIILNFPRTFIGVRLDRHVVMKNQSSTFAMFCVEGSLDNELLPYQEAVTKDDNFSQFHLQPLEGRLHGNQKCILKVTFIPNKPDSKSNYTICYASISIAKWRTLKSPLLEEQKNLVRTKSDDLSNPIQEPVSVMSLDDAQRPQQVANVTDKISLILYGEFEVPQISILPASLNLENLTIARTYNEVIEIKNLSYHLPLLIKTNTRVVPLPPNEPVSYTIRFKPNSRGHVTETLDWELMYKYKEQLYHLKALKFRIYYTADYKESQVYVNRTKPKFNTGITPMICNEVGFLVDDVRFNSKVEMPRQAIVDKHALAFRSTNEALVAFPNDRSKSLRPWRNQLPCKTIYTQEPRTVTHIDSKYDFTPSQQFLKDTNDSYYNNYIRQLNRTRKLYSTEEQWEEYVTSHPKRILCKAPCPILKSTEDSPNLFIPLTPYLIQNVVVYPKFINLGRIAAEKDISDCFIVENTNEFPVHISIKSDKSIKVIQSIFILERNSKQNINFVYHSAPSGIHHLPLLIILNYFHVFNVTILATIVRNSIRVLSKEVAIIPTEKTALLELKNPLNSDVRFEVDTFSNQLKSFPSTGVIPAKKKMLLTIAYHPEIGLQPVKEIAVISECGTKELIDVIFDPSQASIKFSKEEIIFKDLPLNTLVTKELVISNLSNQLVTMEIELGSKEVDFPELTIEPTTAVLLYKEDFVVSFTIRLREICTFRVPIKLIFQSDYERRIAVSGNVLLPVLAFNPDFIKIPKIPAGCYFSSSVTITNLTDAPTYFTIPIQDYSEFCIKSCNKLITEKDTIYMNPNEKKTFLLEFQSKEPVAYCIYMPYILNGIVGPPELNLPSTLKYASYFNHVENKCKTIAHLKESLGTLKILCAVSKNLVEVKSWKLDFCESENVKSFQMKNISKETQVLSIGLEAKPFHIQIPANVEVEENSINICLEPKECLELDIQFKPLTYGQYEAKIAVYNLSYLDGLIYNYLHLTGDYPKPQIKPHVKALYFTPCRAHSSESRVISFKLKHHKCGGNLTHICNLPHILLEPMDNESDDYIRRYKVIFTPTDDCFLEEQITFQCPCRSIVHIFIYAICDRSMIINFFSRQSVHEHSTYPLFPSDDDESAYAVLLRCVMEIIERWIYSQGYYARKYYRIPDMFTRYPIVSNDLKRESVFDKKKLTSQLPLVQLLINLTDDSIFQYIDNKLEPPGDHPQRSLCNYVSYRNCLSFLAGQSIRIPGLKPEHLLTYEEYVEYKEQLESADAVDDNKENFTQDTFYRFSKQRWLDLLMHIYKVLVLQRILQSTSKRQCNIEENVFLRKDRADFDKYFRENSHRFSRWNWCEMKLLLWLEYHYNREKTLLWPDEEFEDNDLLHDFSDIIDSVPVATVMAAYCPYLQDQLRDIYVFPKNIEQRVHNVCKILQTWRMLRFSYNVHPYNIVSDNKIKNIFMITYLYEVLPHFYPGSLVTIEAPLSSTKTYNLIIKNCGNYPIEYTAIFFGKSKLFSLDKTVLSIPGNKTGTLRLTYGAGNALKVSTVLVLSGETGGERYAKSLAVSVIGVPKPELGATEVKLDAATYQLRKRQIEVKSPYRKSYTAAMYIGFEESTSYEDLRSVANIKRSSIPRDFDFEESVCVFGPKGEAVITLSTYCLSERPINFFLYFCNEEIGDFCLSVNICSTLAKTRKHTFKMDIPQSFSSSNCCCNRGFNRSCPKTLTIHLPCKNKFLWECTSIMAKICFSETYKKFYDCVEGQPVVFRSLKFYLERFPDGFLLPYEIFRDEVEFVIDVPKGFSVLNRTLRIPDVTSNQTVPLYLHFDHQGFPRKKVTVALRSNHGEVRKYELILHYDRGSFITNETSKQTISNK